MQVLHGDVVIEVQDDWVDATQIAFVAPPDRSLAEEFARRAKDAGAPVRMEIPAQPKTRANFQLSYRPYFLEDVPPKEFCEKELRAMIAQIPGGKAGELSWDRMGKAEAAVQDVEIQMEGISARQLHALAVLDGRIFHFCGTASRGDYEKAKAGFLTVLRSIRLEKR